MEKYHNRLALFLKSLLVCLESHTYPGTKRKLLKAKHAIGTRKSKFFTEICSLKEVFLGLVGEQIRKIKISSTLINIISKTELESCRMNVANPIFKIIRILRKGTHPFLKPLCIFKPLLCITLNCVKLPISSYSQ